MDDYGKEVLADIGREVRANNKEWERQRKAKWTKEHPRLHNATTGWGKALSKEGKALGASLSYETKKFFGL